MRVDHIAIAVRNLEEGLKIYRDLLGLKIMEVKVVEDEGVKIAFLDAGDLKVEVMEPLGKDTPVGRFLSKRGEGMHHIAFLVTDLDEILMKVKSFGLRLTGEPKPREGGRYVFLHPKSTHGVLIELIEGDPYVQKDTGGE